MNIGHLQEVGASLCDTIFRFVMSAEGRSCFPTIPTPASLSTILQNSSAISLSLSGLEAGGIVDSSSGLNERDIPSQGDYESGSGSDSDGETKTNKSTSAGMTKQMQMLKTNDAHAMPAIESSNSKTLALQGNAARMRQATSPKTCHN
jgi:hypothetical protein